MRTPTSARPRLVVAPLGLLAVLVACGGGEESTVPEETPSPEVTSSDSPDRRVGPVDEARADLAARLDVAPEGIEVLESEAVTWRDGSLGCPEPGTSYTQALVDGHRVVLRSGRRTYPYHSGGGRGPFLCENLRPSIPPQPGDGE